MGIYLQAVKLTNDIFGELNRNLPSTTVPNPMPESADYTASDITVCANLPKDYVEKLHEFDAIRTKLLLFIKDNFKDDFSV